MTSPRPTFSRRLRTAGMIALAVVPCAVSAIAAPTASAALGDYQQNAIAGWYAPDDTLTQSAPTDKSRVEAVLRAGMTSYLGGDFTKMRSPNGSQTVTRNRVAAVDSATGELRTGFNANVNGRVNAIAINAAGDTLFIGGEFTMVNGVAMKGLAALNPSTGALKASTLPNANVSGRVEAIVSNGTQLFVGGSYSGIGGASRSNVARFDLASGVYRLATGWKPNVAGGNVLAMGLDAPRSRVIIGGSFQSVNGVASQKHLAGLSTSTGAPSAWKTHPTDRIIALDLDADGVYAAQGGGNRTYNFAHDGTQRWYFSSDGDNQAITVQGNYIVTGFHGNKIAPSPNKHYQDFPAAQILVRDKVFMLNKTTGMPTSWNPSLTAPNGSPLGVWAADSGDGYLLIGGDFTRVNMVTRARFAMFAPR